MQFMVLFNCRGRRRGWGRVPARRARSRLGLDSPREVSETGVRELARRTAPGCAKTSCSNSAHLPPVSEASRGVHANRRLPTPPPAADLGEWPKQLSLLGIWWPRNLTLYGESIRVLTADRSGQAN